jgi:phosphohistidine phosphatase
MRCIIVRHGKAEASSDTGRDEDRILKPRGRLQAQFLGRALAVDGRRPALIMSSRFERAISTAHIIQKALTAPLHLAPELEVGHPPSLAVDLIQRHASHSPLMFVGHNPQLSELIWLLTHGAPAEESGLRTGEAVVLDLDPPDFVGAARELERLRLDGED